MRSSPWFRLLLALTALKLLGGLVGFAWNPNVPVQAGEDTVASPLFRCIIMMCFSAAGLSLLGSGVSDRRAITLGSFFFVLASAFAYRPLFAIVNVAPPEIAWPALFLYALPVDAFLPWLFWTFAQEFPHSVTSFKVQRFLTWGCRLALLAGLIGLAAQTIVLSRAWMNAVPPVLPRFVASQKPSYEFYGPLLILVIFAFLTLLWRTWSAIGEEGQRARLFVAGLGMGLVPLFLEIVLEAVITPYDAWLDVGNRRAILGTVLIFPALGLALFTTAYSVLVAHVLNVRLIARKALQYALARYSAIGLALVPVLALVGYLYQNRERRLEEIFSGAPLLLLGASAAAGVAAMRYRKTLLDSIDRHFFREQYDAHQTLTLLVEKIRATHGIADLANLLCRETDLALHPETVAFLAFDPRAGVLADPRNRRRLDTSSSLSTLIASASDPLQVDLEDPRSPLARLSETERHWLVDSGFRLIVPILARDGFLLGLIGLGEKKSGQPFLRDDRQLLRAIANSAAWMLELEIGHLIGPPAPKTSDGAPPLPFPEPPPSGLEHAKECPHCGRLFATYTVFCGNCSRRLEPSHVPYVLPGKFRFEQRIGIGGMGVVYRGSDLALGRAVAVKTLRRVSPEDAMRLRREARTAAAVSHPHLAPVYGLETWQGTPMLVMELLEGGTLGQRIEKSPLDVSDTVELGIAMSEALEHLHASDILHRDIKPSNIGYTKDGVPKLMDFGIARVMFDLRRDLEATTEDSVEGDSALAPTSVWNPPVTVSSGSKQLVGTLSYLSPEALIGQPADTSFDLWALAIVLYECLLGRKIFSGGDLQQLMGRIRNGRVPDFSQVCPEHDPLLGDFFRSTLHRTISRRPASAKEMRERLLALRPRLAA